MSNPCIAKSVDDDEYLFVFESKKRKITVAVPYGELPRLGMLFSELLRRHGIHNIVTTVGKETGHAESD